MKGKMSVHSDRNRLLEKEIYYSSEEMKLIMGKWMRDYPEGFYIMVRPRPHGNQHQTKIKLHIPEKKHKPFVRPPAIYDNQKNLY